MSEERKVDTNIYRGTIEKTGEKVLVWGGTYDMENASIRWYEVSDERDWSDDKFSDFELLSTHQLHLQLAETLSQRTALLSKLREDVEGLTAYWHDGEWMFKVHEVLAVIEKGGEL